MLGSDVLDAPDRRPLDLCPVYALVQRLVHDAHRAHVVAAHEVQPERDLDRGLVVVRRPDDSFRGILQDLFFFFLGISRGTLDR